MRTWVLTEGDLEHLHLVAPLARRSVQVRHLLPIVLPPHPPLSMLYSAAALQGVKLP